MLVLLPLLALLLPPVVSWDIDVAILNQLSGAVGGEPFVAQPVVEIRDKRGNLLTDIAGTIAVDLFETPSGNERICRVEENDAGASGESHCEEKTGDCPKWHSVDVSGGKGAFDGLYLNEAGGGYQLRYVFRDEYGIAMGFVVGDPFMVEKGIPYRIRVISQPGQAYGGAVWGDQPVVAVEDRGFNLLQGVSEGTVSIHLADEVDEGPSLLRSKGGVGDTVPIVNGVAIFDGLYINDSRYSYTLNFTTSLDLPGTSVCNSVTFSVSVGLPHKIFLEKDPSQSIVYGGRAFSLQPRIKVIDAGGNLLADDYSSFVRVSIYSNPSQGTLSPFHGKLAPVLGGVAQFENLSIDRAGVGYQLEYSLLGSNERKMPLDDHGIFKSRGDTFDVIVGSPHQLRILQRPSSTWAGNQPFRFQPVIGLCDAGGNVVTSESRITITALLAQSLSHSSHVVIDTTNDDVPRVESVSFGNDILGAARNVYGSGDNISVRVLFSQEVIVQARPNVSQLDLPSLELNVQQNTSEQAFAFAFLKSQVVGYRTRSLLFEFAVETHHSQGFLNYRSMESLQSNDYSINDAFGRHVSLSLPSKMSGLSLGASRSIEVNSSPAFISSIFPSLDESFYEFGTGQEINFQVLFNREVSVLGSPRLPLQLNSKSRNAIYAGGNGTSTLTFVYVVQDGDAAVELDVDASENATVVLLSTSDAIHSKNSGNSSLLTPAYLGLQHIKRPNSVNITIDTQSPRVVAVAPQTDTTPDGVYTIGDTVFLEVSFSKPVVVDVGLQLVLDTGPITGVARYDSGSGSAILLMRYDVIEGQVSSDLNYVDTGALLAWNGSEEGFVRRDATTPTTPALLVLPPSGSTIADIADIVIDGVRPIIRRISLGSEFIGRVFRERDQLGIDVLFTADVVVSGSPPVLDFFFNGKQRWAFYFSGSRTSTLRFVYKVVVGDSGTSRVNLTYRRVCLNIDCMDREGATPYGAIERLSAIPSLAVDLTPFPVLLPIEESVAILVDATNPSPTTIVRVTTSHSSGTYGVGEEIYFLVEFTDTVLVPGTPPRLCTNLVSDDSSFTYRGGSETNLLAFVHVVSTLDSLETKLNWSVCPPTSSIIHCATSEGCNIENTIGQSVDLTFDSGKSIEPVIGIDISPPSIVNVYSSKSVSSHCMSHNHLRSSKRLCSYTAGETIDIVVVFDLPVVVGGSGLCLPLDVFDSAGVARCAQLNPSRSSSMDLVFTYTVQVGDTSRGSPLTYLCEPRQGCSLSLGSGGLDSVMRSATYLTMAAIVSLPTPSPHGVSNDSNIPIIIDATRVPRIDQVFSLTNDDIYTQGDIIDIMVVFTEPVVVTGVPSLTLDVGSKAVGAASYTRGSGSTDLLFEYTIGANHTSFDLDYVDINSLDLGGLKGQSQLKGGIRFASTHPIIKADLLLPAPSRARSLSYTSDIVVDTRVPNVVSISSPDSPGRYVTGDFITILVEFSVPIVVSGRPFLQLETGEVDRKAHFESQIGKTMLRFQYVVELGDVSRDLDYWTDESLFRSSSSSFDLNGGTIKREAQVPVLHADLHLNPGQGYLDGTLTIPLQEGIASYESLRIATRGHDYKIRFKSPSLITGVELEATATLEVDFSSEYQLVGDQYDRNIGDRFGFSAAIDGNTVVVGAPGTRRPVPEVQELTILAGASLVENEVQIISTSVNATEAIKRVQSFSTSAAPGKAVSGRFLVACNRGSNYQISSSVALDASTGGKQLESILTESFPMLGNINVYRTANRVCNCSNAWNWTVTFLDALVSDPVLRVEGEELSGDGATISQVAMLRDTDMIGGTFYLFNPLTNITSREIPYDASTGLVKQAIEADLGITVKYIRVTNTDDHGRDLPELGRQWKVTFANYLDNFGTLDANVPNLEADSGGILGTNAVVWTHVVFEGRAPLGGSFALRFRGSQFSDYIKHNSSADAVKLALESIESVNAVSVSRTNIASKSQEAISGNSWVVTFHSVNQRSGVGWTTDTGCRSNRKNLPALEVSSHLVGWNVSYKVEYEHGSGPMDTQAQWMLKNKRDIGAENGAVYVITKEGEQWKHESRIFAEDHAAFDNFGRSVSLNGSVLLAGAPSKSFRGLPEQQALRCAGTAVEGFFFLAFRGFVSEPIVYNATIGQIKTAIEGPYGETGRAHTLPRIMVEPVGSWDGRNSPGFCQSEHMEGNEALITFLTPDGGGVSTVHGTRSDIEMLTADYSSLDGAVVTIREVRKDTRSPIGKEQEQHSSTNPSAGAAYIFERELPCEFCTYSWAQVAKLTPFDGNDMPSDSGEFGWSVSLGLDRSDFHSTAVVGSPGFANDSGKVYVFRKEGGTDARWRYHSFLTSQVWTMIPLSGDRFGDSVALDDHTIFVSAPGHSARRGKVYVFQKENGNGTAYLPSQAIAGPREMEPESRFGHSLSISGNSAVICAPGISKGECYVYTRPESAKPYKFDQKLVASNLIAGDRFGWSVALSRSRIVVGQLEAYDGDLLQPRPVQVLEVFCRFSCCMDSEDSTLSLFWRRDVSKVSRTKEFSINATSGTIREIMERELQMGPISVSKVSKSSHTTSYYRQQWSITFDDFLTHGKRARSIPVVGCLVGDVDRFGCSVQVERGVPRRVRGKAHAFTLSTNGKWIEQAFLFPNAPQRQDMLGTSIGLDHKTAILGAPNREVLNVNSGAVMVVDLSFLDMSFLSANYTVVEGDSLKIGFSRVEDDTKQFFRVRSMERNTRASWQNYVDELYSFRSTELFPLAKTSIDLLTHSTAFGGNLSNWFNGMYDYRGISDFQTIDEALVIEKGSRGGSILFQSTNDGIYEAPDENVTLMFHVAGAFSSQLGNLTTTINIQDDGDSVWERASYYQKLKSRQTSRLGMSIDMDTDSGLLVVGTESGTEVQVFRRENVTWTRVASLSPPRKLKQHSYFGKSVAIDTPYGRSSVTVLVGAPGECEAFIFVLELSNDSWQLQARLRPFGLEDNAMFQDCSGSPQTIALSGDLAFFGSSELETVWSFRRTYSSERSEFSWAPWKILRSNEYDFDLYRRGSSARHMHLQYFGFALAADRRSLLVGAPFADYGNRGHVEVRKTYDTDGIDNKGLGKGKVFVFSSKPHIQTIALRSDEKLRSGSFFLVLRSHHGMDGRSALIEYNSSARALKTALEQASNIGEVEVSHASNIDIHRSDKYQSVWRVTFITEVADTLSPLEAIWDEMPEVTALSSFEPTITVSISNLLQELLLETDIQPEGGISGDGFGMSLAIDKNQAIIGAMHSSSGSRTIFDFEMESRAGWFSTGDAFRSQQILGDEKTGKSTDQRHYISTSDAGTNITGTLTSDPFLILGNEISFLTGGGCKELFEYLELLVDGFPSMRATGKCSKGMKRVYWNVGEFKGRAAQIRIVDNSIGKWGHIDISNIEFDWNIAAERGGNESAMAGAAYLFYKHDNSGVWSEEERIVASDKRGGSLFGFSVDVDDVTGLAIVGSPHASIHGFYGERLGVFTNSKGHTGAVTFPVSEDYEDFVKSGGTYSATGGNVRLVDHLLFAQGKQDDDDRISPTGLAKQGGAIYIFKRRHDATGHASWQNVEDAKIFPTDVGPRDKFGYCLSLDGSAVAVGAVGGDLHANNDGAAYILDISAISIKFSKTEYYVQEGCREVKIFLERDANALSMPAAIGFSTSDLTAEGSDSPRFQECLKLDLRDRRSCGDYERRSGTVSFKENIAQVYFTVQIMDDATAEDHMEYVQLQLHLPGGGPIHGEKFRAQIRIDDDDSNSN